MTQNEQKRPTQKRKGNTPRKKEVFEMKWMSEKQKEDMTRADKLEAYAKKEWEEMTEEEKSEYDNDFDFFVYDLYFCMLD